MYKVVCSMIIIILIVYTAPFKRNEASMDNANIAIKYTTESSYRQEYIDDRGEKKSNININKEIVKEDSLLAGQIYEQGGMVVAKMIIKDGIKKEQYEKLALKYFEMLKNAYKDKDIIVEANQGGVKVVDILYKEKIF